MQLVFRLRSMLKYRFVPSIHSITIQFNNTTIIKRTRHNLICGTHPRHFTLPYCVTYTHLVDLNLLVNVLYGTLSFKHKKSSSMKELCLLELLLSYSAETVDCLRSFSIMLPNLCWSWALYQVCWVVTYSSLVTQFEHSATYTETT